MREGKFAGKSIAELKNFVLTTIYPDLEGKSVEIAKHVPHEFQWKWMNEDEIVKKQQGKGKNKKEVELVVGKQDIRQFPILLKDGDHIGVRFGLPECEGEEQKEEDDFQTEEDRAQKEQFDLAAAQKKAENQIEKATKLGAQDNKGITIKLEDDEITVFDQIVAKEIPCEELYSDDKVIAFKDNNPVAPVHFLVIPKNKDGLTGISQAKT